MNAGFQTDRGTQTPTPLHAHTPAFLFLFQSHSLNFHPGSSQTQRQWTAATVSLWVSSWMFGGSAKLVLKTVCKCLTVRPKEISESNQIPRKICAMYNSSPGTTNASIHVSTIGSEYICSEDGGEGGILQLSLQPKFSHSGRKSHRMTNHNYGSS